MRKFWFVLLALGLALGMGMFACGGDDGGGGDGDSDGDSDGDTDADTDADSDTDADTDTDTDSDVDCGTLDAECCAADPYCDANLTAVNLIEFEGDPGTCYCFGECTIATCTVGGDALEDGGTTEEIEGYCNDPYQSNGVEEIGNCINDVDFPDPFEALYECTPEETGCMTNSGDTTDTECMELVAGTICLSDCDLPTTDDPEAVFCDLVHSCNALVSSDTGEFTGTAACIPN